MSWKKLTILLAHAVVIFVAIPNVGSRGETTAIESWVRWLTSYWSARRLSVSCGHCFSQGRISQAFPCGRRNLFC